jgi:hypothetical protein
MAGKGMSVRSQFAAAAIVAAGLAAGLAARSSADTSSVTPILSPDRIDDAPSADKGAFALIDNFAWRAFIALNWPSLPDSAHRGAPDRSKSLGDEGKRVWETFKSDYELFPLSAEGSRVAPSPWTSYDGRNPCGEGLDRRDKTIASFEPFADFNQPSFTVGQPANPLVGVNGAYTRYEIHFNEVEFSAFAGNGWSQAQNLPDETHPAHLPTGSIAVKAAWLPMSEAEAEAARGRYYLETAEIVDVAKTLAQGRVVCAKSAVALVGLHIAIKTESRPQWVWSTFEHVDNVPPAGQGEAREPDARDGGRPYAYFDPSRPAKLWPPFGSAGAEPVDATNPPQLHPTPMQVIRRYPIHGPTMAINHAYWALPGVKGTVWEHYMLVADQWPTSPDPPSPANDGSFFPGGKPATDSTEDYKSVAVAQENLINTTMETYLQDAPSSCMACHQLVSNSRGADFVGMLAGLK